MNSRGVSHDSKRLLQLPTNPHSLRLDHGNAPCTSSRLEEQTNIDMDEGAGCFPLRSVLSRSLRLVANQEAS